MTTGPGGRGRSRSSLAATLLVVCLASALLPAQIPPFGGQSAYVADLGARRAAVMAALGPDTTLILSSAPPRVFSTDTNYEYRQESNLLYLSGLIQESVTLVLVNTSSGLHEFVFAPVSDATRELWTGHVPSAPELQAATGVAHVFTQRSSEAYDAFMHGLLGIEKPSPTGTASEAERAGASLSPPSGRMRLAFLDTAASLPTGRRIDVSVVDAGPTLLKSRQIKTPYEQQLLRRSVEISAQAHIEGMRATRPGRWEYEVEAAIEFWFLKNGALSWGYPSIVASGPNATTLHYIKSTRQMQPGDLLLVDAAGNLQGLTGDITRTYPVSRRFTPEQRAVYEVVLAAQGAGIAAARPGGTAADITQAVRASIGAGLLKLGLVTDPAAATGDSAQIAFWFPHSPVHGIGIDVHDPLGPLEPGAAFVIEPGLYIRSDTFERIRRDPALADFARSIEPAVSRYRDLGIRIEDSFLMTQAGPDNLSRLAPKLVRDIERVVGTGR